MQLFCKIYLDPSVPTDTETVAGAVFESIPGPARVGARTVTGERLEVEVLPNRELDGANSLDPGDFLLFPYVLEVTPAAEALTRADFVEATSRLLAGLGHRGYRYSASCDFAATIPGGVS